MASVCPFGPLIYCGDIRGEFLDFLLKHLDEMRTASDASYRLVGNIKHQVDCPYPVNQFMGHLKPHVFSYLKSNYDREVEINNYFKKDNKKDNIDQWIGGLDPTDSKVKFNLGGGPWINFQQKNEFNPLHNHRGVISAVLFIDIPDDLEVERKTSGFQAEASGCLDLVHNDQHIVVHPRAGDMYMFPSYLWHIVYPYKSDVERISMSFNLTEVSIDEKRLATGLDSILQR